MNKPTLQQARTAVVETAVAVGLELAFVELARRITHGRAAPQPDDAAAKRRVVRRTAAAVLVELREAGVAESRWQGHRMKAVVDQAAARQSAATTLGTHAQVPQQRSAPETPLRPHVSRTAGS